MSEIFQASAIKSFTCLLWWKQRKVLIPRGLMFASWLRKLSIASPCWRRMVGGLHVSILVLILSFWVIPTSAASVNFQNCLSDNIRYNQPLALQLVPEIVDVTFNTKSQKYQLNVTVWANVTGSIVGSAPKPNFPSANDTDYWNGDDTGSGGKIQAIPLPESVNKQTTLYNRIDFMTYQPIREYLSFCDHLTNGACPLGPVWNEKTNA